MFEPTAGRRPIHDHMEALWLVTFTDVGFAVLDIMVGGRPTSEVADVLASRGVALLHSTGHGRLGRGLVASGRHRPDEAPRRRGPAPRD